MAGCAWRACACVVCVPQADAGYNLVEILEGWESVHVNGTTKTAHDANGNNMIDTTKYPDMAALVKYGHGKGVRVGWSLNNGNAEPSCLDINQEGDIRNLKQLGFDSVRLYGYGPCRNNSR